MVRAWPGSPPSPRSEALSLFIREKPREPDMPAREPARRSPREDPSGNARFDVMLPGATAFDTALRSWIVARQTPAGLQIAAIVSQVGGVGVMRWIAVFATIFLMARARRPAALAVIIAPLLALAAYAGTRRFFPRVRPPGAAGFHEAASSFPSAHATTSAAVCFTLAYFLWRERFLAAPAAMAIAIVPPLCVGLSRLYLDVHWSTDVLAGWCAGLAILAVAVSFYRLWPAPDES